MNPNKHLTRKRILAGSLWPKSLGFVDRFNRNAEFLDFLRESPTVPVFSDGGRYEFFLFLNEKVLGGRAIDYLEFGVHQGATLRNWTEINRNEGSRFFGFDSFEGLPEAWNENSPKGKFKVSDIPQFADPRVSLVKGWYKDTLSPFMDGFRAIHPLVVHIDCDLYSSALLALTKVDSQLRVGSIVIFDEFSDQLNEFRAYQDYRRAYGRDFRLLAATERFMRVAVQVQ